MRPRGRIKYIAGFAILAFGILSWNAIALDRSTLRQLFTTALRGNGSSTVLPTFNDTSFHHTSNPHARPEDMIVQSLLEVSQGKLQQASDTIDQLLTVAPNFKLAQLVRGDLLMARAQQFQGFGSPASGAERVADFKEEARKRIERHLAKLPPSDITAPVWQMESNQTYAIFVDTDKSRLYVYRREGDHLVYQNDYYVTIGKNGSEKVSEGDKRTPIGVYFLGQKLNRKLEDIYGDAAYPISYPNEWDRRQGKSGSGIWLHGTPHDTYNRPPKASDGCVVLSNPDLAELAPILEKGNVPIIIGKGSPNAASKNADDAIDKQGKDTLKTAIETWRADWQQQDTDAYLAHYAPQFTSDSMDLSKWSVEKRRIQASKPKVDIKLSDISMYRYPNSEKPMAVVTFNQSFKSPFVDNQMRKRQYWIYDHQQWKILYEGAA